MKGLFIKGQFVKWAKVAQRIVRKPQPLEVTELFLFLSFIAQQKGELPESVCQERR